MKRIIKESNYIITNLKLYQIYDINRHIILEVNPELQLQFMST